MARFRKSLTYAVSAVVGGFAAGFVVGTYQSFASQLANVQATCLVSFPKREEVSCDTNEMSKQSNKQEGWASIEVFFGNTTSQLSVPRDKEWFAQSQQDIAVSTILRGKRDGFFIDLAANHPTFLSNTYSLEQKFNWNGLCIEANPRHWAGLVYRNCQVVGAVVGNQTMEQVHFKFLNTDGVGGHAGIVGNAFGNRQAEERDMQAKYTVTLLDIFVRFKVPRHIDYLSLDVEGAESFILKHFPFQDYHISVMTLERPKPLLRNILQRHGFVLLATHGGYGETLWVHDSVSIPPDWENQLGRDWEFPDQLRIAVDLGDAMLRGRYGQRIGP